MTVGFWERLRKCVSVESVCPVTFDFSNVRVNVLALQLTGLAP